MHATATEKMAAGEYLTVTEEERKERSLEGVLPVVVAGVHRGNGQQAIGASGYGAKGRAVSAPVSFPNDGKLSRVLMTPRVVFTHVKVPPVPRAALRPVAFPLVNVTPGKCDPVLVLCKPVVRIKLSFRSMVCKDRTEFVFLATMVVILRKNKNGFLTETTGRGILRKHPQAKIANSVRRPTSYMCTLIHDASHPEMSIADTVLMQAPLHARVKRERGGIVNAKLRPPQRVRLTISPNMQSTIMQAFLHARRGSGVRGVKVPKFRATRNVLWPVFAYI